MSMRLPETLEDLSTWSASGWCPIESAMGVVGSRGSVLIMREAYYGVRRFDDFVARTAVSPATAAAHLHALVEAGLLQRQPYRVPGSRSRAEYRLTEAVTDLMPVLLGLFQWGLKHTDIRPRAEFVHADCGKPVEARVQCEAGHDVTLDEIELVPKRRQ